MELVLCCISIPGGRCHLLFLTWRTALHTAMLLQSPHVISKSVSIILNETISVLQSIMFCSITTHPNTRIIIPSQTKGYSSSNPEPYWGPEKNKSTEKACLPRQIVLPSKHQQCKDFLEVICEALASKKALYKECHVSTSWKASISFGVLQFPHYGKQ